MRRIITAMGNPTLNNELNRYEEFEILESDLFYQDAVIDVFDSEDIDVLIVSALLQGQMEFGEFIEKLCKVNPDVRIIVVTDEITSNMKRTLSQSGIVDIFMDSEVEIADIIDAIKREEPLKKKAESMHKHESSGKFISASQTDNVAKCSSKMVWGNTSEEAKDSYYSSMGTTLRQEIITVSGINGAGKSTFVANFSKTLSQKTNAKILIIDFDTLNGNVDEILEINKVPQNVEILIDENKKCGLNYAAELISKNRFDSNVFEELVIDTGDVDILTGNTSLHYCQNVLCEEYYEKILECAKEKYDFIILDTSSNIFLDSTRWSLQKATRVFFITENNYLSMKKSQQFMEVITSGWGILNSKIQIVINKRDPNGIDLEVVEKILEKFKTVGEIKIGEQNLETSYIKILETINYIPKTTVLEKILAYRRREIVSNRLPRYRGSIDRTVAVRQ